MALSLTQKKAAAIQLLILDVDGVLTDGKIWYSADQKEHKAFHTQDGYGLKQLQAMGIHLSIISGRTSDDVARRMKELNICSVFQGQSNKLTAYESLLKAHSLTDDQVAYVGDDTPDLVLMQRVGLPIAVANAVKEVKAVAAWCTQRQGGEGAVREACDFILSAKASSNASHESQNALA